MPIQEKHTDTETA